MKKHLPGTNPSRKAFTFVEMLVAISLTAIFVGTAALTMAAISANSKQYSSILDVEIGSSAMRNFYDMEGGNIKAPSAPNFGRLGFVHEIRDKMYEDAALSEAIFCLPRSGLNEVRPEWLDWPHASTPETRPVLDSPEAFRQFLADAEPTSSGIFEAYRNVPSSGTPHMSIFLLGPTDQKDFVKVQAVYEIDQLAVNNPSGIYVSVRRYKNGARTHYYDIFYEDGPQSPLIPGFVVFERRTKLVNEEGDAVDRFKKAHGNPFYFIWLPDPSINPMMSEEKPGPPDPKNPKKVYGRHAGKTGFMVTLPMFPSL